MVGLLWEDVDSSTVESVAYYNAFQQLYIKFSSNSEAIYMYQGVPPEVHHELMNAESIGSFFNKEIKPKYDCFRKV